MNAAKKAKVKKVINEYRAGTLTDRGGNKVTSFGQALAIAMSEAGVSKKDK